MTALLAPAACAVIFLLPLVSRHLVRVFLKTRPLEQGELRERLRTLASRAGVPVREIRVLEKEGGPSGRLLGLGKGSRCVLLSARLLARHSPSDLEEVEAVFAHELGHARRSHLLYSILFLAAFLLAFSSMERGALELPPWIRLPALAGAATAWLGLGFRWITRRFEIEADQEASELLGLARYREVLARLGALGRLEALAQVPSDARAGLKEERGVAPVEENSPRTDSGLGLRGAIVCLFLLGTGLQLSSLKT